MADRTKPVSIRLTGAEIEQLQARAYAVSGTVTGRGQVSISVATPRLPLPASASDSTSSLPPDETASPAAVAAGPPSSVAPKIE